MKLSRITLLIAAAGLVLAQGNSALERAMRKETLEGDLKGAIESYRKLAQDKDRTVAAKALLRMGECYEKLGDAEARKAYERVVRDFGDQKDAVAVARARLGGTARSEIVARQVWSDRFAEGGPSPDGRYLAWSNWHSNGNLSIHDFVTGENHDLTHRTDGSDAENPIFLPDGKHIMFGWYDAGADEWSLRTIAVDGSSERIYR